MIISILISQVYILLQQAAKRAIIQASRRGFDALHLYTDSKFFKDGKQIICDLSFKRFYCMSDIMMRFYCMVVLMVILYGLLVIMMTHETIWWP